MARADGTQLIAPTMGPSREFRIVDNQGRNIGPATSLAMAILAILFLTTDWTYGSPNTGALMFARFATRTGVAAQMLSVYGILAWISLQGRLSRIDKLLGTAIVVGTTFVAVIVALVLMIPTDHTVFLSPESYVYEFLAPIAFWAGLRVGFRRENVYLILNWMAWGLAVISFISYALRVINIPGFPPVTYWPKTIFVLGFFWFFMKLVCFRFRVADLIGLVLTSLEVLLAFTKHTYIDTIVTLAALICFLVVNKDLRPGNLVRVIASIALIGAAAGAYYTFGTVETQKDIDFRLNRMVSTNTTNRDLHTEGSFMEGLANGRLDIWLAAWERLESSPLVGHGFGQSNNAVTGSQQVSFHNGYLDWLVSVGLLGALPVAIAVIGWWKAIWRCIAGIKGEPMVAYMAAIAVGYMVANLGSSTRFLYGSWILWLFITGAACRFSIELWHSRTHEVKV